MDDPSVGRVSHAYSTWINRICNIQPLRTSFNEALSEIRRTYGHFPERRPPYYSPEAWATRVQTELKLMDEQAHAIRAWYSQQPEDEGPPTIINPRLNLDGPRDDAIQSAARSEKADEPMAHALDDQEQADELTSSSADAGEERVVFTWVPTNWQIIQPMYEDTSEEESDCIPDTPDGDPRTPFKSKYFDACMERFCGTTDNLNVPQNIPNPAYMQDTARGREGKVGRQLRRAIKYLGKYRYWTGVYMVWRDFVEPAVDKGDSKEVRKWCDERLPMIAGLRPGRASDESTTDS